MEQMPRMRGIIHEVETAGRLLSPSWSSGRDSRGYIPSIVYIPLWLLILLSFLSHSFFLFSFDEIQRSGNATCIIKCGEKNMTGSRNNFVYPCNGSRSWWKFRLFEILFTGRILVDRWFSRGLWFRDVEKWETRAVSMDSLVAPGSQDLGIMKIVGDLTDGGLKLKFLYLDV